MVPWWDKPVSGKPRNYMKQIKSSGGYWILVLCGVVAGRVMGQGTAFTYQGQLQNNGSPASGTYNMTFTLFAASSDGGPMAGPVPTGSYVEYCTQSVLMSSSMARTAPARTNKSASETMVSPGPAT